MTTFLLDRDGNQVAEISPLGYFSCTAYNQDNQPVTQVDADGRTTSSTYDPAGRLITQIWTAADGAQTNVLTYSYDAVGNMTVAGNAYGDYTFTYDPANRVLTQTDPFNLTLTFGYDANGNVTSVADSAGGTVTSIYNADNELTSRRFATTANGSPASVQLRMDLAYTPAGQIATETRYADTAGTDLLGQTQFTYDPSGNVTEIEHTNAASTVLLEYQYQYDAADRLSSETDTYNGTPTTTTYGYDASNELTSANSATFTYDANGNRTMAGYQTSADNELLSDGTWNYAYDPAGNMISQVGISNGLAWYYTYDNQNRVLTASEYSNGQLVEQETNSYDVFGNMVEQDETTGGNTTVTKFANQVKNTSGVSRVWADLNASNQIQTRRVYLDAVDAVCAESAPMAPRAGT